MQFRQSQSLVKGLQNRSDEFSNMINLLFLLHANSQSFY